MNRLSLAAVLLVLSSCTPAPNTPDEVDDVLRIAKEYVDGYYHQFPEEAYEIGYPDTPMDRLGDRGQDAMNAWRAREDHWLASLQDLDSEVIESTRAEVPHAFAIDRLRASVARRVCRGELWNVSPTWTGWQATLSSTLTQQPVGTAEQRDDALARLRAVPGYLDTEVTNLRTGMDAGYLAAKPDVDAVLEQLTEMLSAAPEDSPFYAPASRSADDDFRSQVRTLVDADINPAIARYRAFLDQEYTPRESVGVSSNPDGDACYAASVRFHTSLEIGAQEIHETGLREMERIQGEMARIAHESFDTDDVKTLLQTLRTDSAYTFRSEEEVLEYARDAVDRAGSIIRDWVGFVPDAELVIRPFPAYQKASGGGFYSSGSLDGSRPGVYELGTYRPETIPRAGLQSTSFHETWPGHHLQMSVALFGKGVHPVLRYLYVASMAEGWGLYSERLADEMGLYSTEVDRLGMLSNEALRAARLVVDSGMHVLGWSRSRAVQYMMDNTAESRAAIESEVDRYLATPAQATAYMIGSLEIRRLRAEARDRLGEQFDIKGFHDVLLADGAVSLPMLRRAVERWMSDTRNEAHP